jgi:hypothetical protein
MLGCPLVSTARVTTTLCGHRVEVLTFIQLLLTLGLKFAHFLHQSGFLVFELCVFTNQLIKVALKLRSNLVFAGKAFVVNQRNLALKLRRDQLHLSFQFSLLGFEHHVLVLE